MPANSLLNWLELDDFTAGLFDESAVKGRFASPPKAFRTLDDAQPIKGGGVRAFIKPTAIDLTGIGANETPICIFARNGWNRAVGVGGTGNDSTDMVMVTMNSSDFKVRIYRRDGSVSSPAWSNRFTTAAGSAVGHQICDVAYFRDINSVEWYLFSVFASNPLSGLYSMRVDDTIASNTGNDGLVAKQQSYCGPLCISQARIFIGSGTDERLFYSDVAAITFTGPADLPITPNRAEAALSIISNIEPADVIIGKEGAPWVVLSGDIANSSTPVREMGDDHHQRQDKQQVPRVPGGIAFIEGQGRVFVTADGRTFTDLSPNLGYFPLSYSPGMVGTGTMGYINSLLFSPGPTGKANVYDFDAGCWFRATGNQAVFSWGDPYGGNMFCANHSDSAPSVVTYNVTGAATRVATYVVETVPYSDKNGRNIDIREVQLYVNTYATSEFRVDIINEVGSIVATRYANVAGSQRTVLSLKFPYSKSRYLSCRVTPRSLNGATEAPTLERIRVGFGINNVI